MIKLRDLVIRLKSVWPLWDCRTLRLFTNREVLEYLRGSGWVERDTKHYSAWRQTLERSTDWTWRLAHPFPCYAYGAIDFIEEHVNSRVTVAEFGCGTSTLWWAARAAKVIAVEHDPRWYALIRKAVPSNVELRLVPVQSGTPSRPEFASHVLPGNFEAYVKALDDMPDGSLSILCVDGRARAGCLLRAHHKVDKGGYIILDNCHRRRYQGAIQQLCAQGWHARLFRGNGPYLAAEQHTMIFLRHPI